eukprot:1183593-Prorocentrum_minimum.AAC.1
MFILRDCDWSVGEAVSSITPRTANTHDSNRSDVLATGGGQFGKVFIDAMAPLMAHDFHPLYATYD